MLNSLITIDDLLNAKEGEHYQFKEAKRRFDSDEATQICCALANCGGGMLVLGITDKRPRKVVGSEAFDQPERTRKGLIDKLKVMVDFQILFLRQYRTNELVRRRMNFSSDAMADFEGLLEVNRKICKQQMAEKASPTLPTNCAVLP